MSYAEQFYVMLLSACQTIAASGLWSLFWFLQVKDLFRISLSEAGCEIRPLFGLFCQSSSLQGHISYFYVDMCGRPDCGDHCVCVFVRRRGQKAYFISWGRLDQLHEPFFYFVSYLTNQEYSFFLSSFNPLDVLFVWSLDCLSDYFGCSQLLRSSIKIDMSQSV